MLSAEAENLQLIKKLITAIANRDFAGVTDCFAGDVILHVPGNTLVSGTFKGVNDVMSALGHVAQMSGESLKIRLHDAMANDQHGIVMYEVSAEHASGDIAYSHIDVYHFRDGHISEISGYPSDLAAFDRLYG